MNPEQSPRAELVVDLAAIRHNVRVIKEYVGTRYMAVVKADGYGHGMVEVARAARQGGADWLGVATIDEALALRAAGDTGPLLCWLTVPGDRWGDAIAADVEVTIRSEAELAEVIATGLPARVQLKIDTGLNRSGSSLAAWPELCRAVAAQETAGRVRVTGVWSHLSSSDEPEDPANDAQEAVLDEALEIASAAGLSVDLAHIANSAAALLRPSARRDMVRVGIASYGLDPAPGITPDIGLRPAMTARARLSMVRHVESGAAVSYGRSWIASTPTTLGLVPAGYADGLPRSGSNRAEVAVNGQRCPVRGKICMDQFVVDLNGADPGAGAEVIIFGAGLDGEPTAQDWAEACNTISYEIVTGIGGRFVRRYVDSEKIDS